MSEAAPEAGAIGGPVPAAGRGPLDERFDGLVRERFDAIMKAYPMYATYVGIHSEDGRLADLSREALESQIQAEKRFIADLEALDADGLSAAARFERDVALHRARRALFDDDVHRAWERRAAAAEEIGDALFLLLARDFAPLPERLESMASRLEGAPTAIEQAKTRVVARPQRLWNELELESVGSLPSLLDEIVAAGRTVQAADSAAQRRLEVASTNAKAALEAYAGWIRERSASATDDFALGGERYDELISLRAFDGLTADQVLAIGWEQLEANHEGRRRAAAEIDPKASEREVVDRVKADHPPDFDAALAAYRESMSSARDFVAEHEVATIPEGEQLSVVPTPAYLRNVMPFAAYFQPAKFDAQHRGIYVVTPSVDGDPRALLEHNHASISNTSIHEAYPGHHLQLSTAVRHPSLSRLLTDAPEFVEGWAMYCEQMMREQGFDTTPAHYVIMYTDAIWRACRIILDIRLHRGEIGVDEAIDFLVEHTGFERPNATAEVNRYTYTPTYQLSYLLGKVMLLRLRDDERQRLGERFSLKGFHDTLMAAGSLPVSFHRRLLAGEGTPAA